METLIYPDIFGKHMKAFFTGKSPGVELDVISKLSGFKKENIYLPIQKHTDKVLLLDSDLSPKIADAVITKDKGILIGVQTADCVPILLCDIKRNAMGAVHAGWKGTAAGILKNTIAAMCEKLSSSPPDILIAIGPSIRGCCYHVGYDVFESVVNATGKDEYAIAKNDAYCIDLAIANKHQAISAGVIEKNIWMSKECTYCQPAKFYSYRYSKGSTGRQAGFIGIRQR